MVYSLFHVGYMVRKIDSIWEYSKDLKNCRFLYKFCKNDFPRGISRIKSHLSRTRVCDVQIWEWRKRDSVGVGERIVGGEQLNELVMSHK